MEKRKTIFTSYTQGEYIVATLQHYFNGQIQKEYVISDKTTIGRNDTNDVTIDNLGISSYHAKIFSESGAFFLEDLSSTNGTFVDGHRVEMHILEHNQIITLGKHYLKFSDHQKALLEASENNANETILAEPSINMNQAVRSYKRENSATNTAFIMMEDNTSLPITGAFIVGKGKDSNVVLDGWFAPKVSFIVDQKVDGYYITSMDNKVKVNGEAVKSLQKLSSRDLISVRGKKFQVHLSYKK